MDLGERPGFRSGHSSYEVRLESRAGGRAAVGVSVEDRRRGPVAPGFAKVDGSGGWRKGGELNGGPVAPASLAARPHGYVAARETPSARARAKGRGTRDGMGGAHWSRMPAGPVSAGGRQEDSRPAVVDSLL